MGGSTIAMSETKIEALKLQSSAYGVTIPVIGGVNRIPGNLIWYGDFKSTPFTSTQGGKGGGVKTQNTTYSYSASVLMGICQGPIGAVARVWKGKEVFTGGWSSALVLRQTDTYTLPASGAMVTTMSHGATIIGSPDVSYDITFTYTSETDGSTWTTVETKRLASGTDYRISGSTVTFLRDDLRGTTIKIAYQWGNGAPDLSPLASLGISLANGDMGQAPATWLATSHPTESLAYPGLAYVHAQDYDLGSGAQVDNHSFEVQGSGAYRYGASKPDCNPAEFTADLMANGRYGARMPADRIDVKLWIDYCAAAGLLMSPLLTEQQRASDFIDTICRLTNAAPVWSVDRLRIVPYGDTTLTGNGVTYTPNVTPLYDLDDDHWLQDGNEDPLQWNQKQPADRYNHIKVEYCDRANYYNKAIAEAQDDADIGDNGRRTKSTISAPWICDADVARVVAQLELQRSLNITGTGRALLPWAYCLLECMDLVTITDPALGFDKRPVRITAIGENEDGRLEVEFEDWPLGTAAATLYPSQVPGGFLHDYNASPGDIDTPVIFEAPYTLTVTGLEVYAAVRGVSPMWGGCQVWVSIDGSTYRQVGTVYGGSRYGSLASVVGSTVAVQGLASVQLLSGTADDATALQTLCWLGGTTQEYLAYETATLTGAGAYTLGGLVRAAYGTTATAHAIGAPFARVDERVAKSGPLDPALIGQTIQLKFTSFNVYGGGQQSLADVSAVPYTITGGMYSLAPTPTGGGSSPSLVLNPAAATLQANVDGVVTDFGPGRSVATVVQSDGTDVTSAWTFTKVDTGVVSTLSGTLGNIVTVTGYDPAGVATSWANVVLQVHCNGSWADSSRYGRTINNINPGTTFASGAPFTGAYSGRQVARYVTDQWSWCNNVFGPDPSIRKTGGPWSVRCRVRFSALPSILTTFSFCGSSFFGSFKATRVGSALNLSYVWNGSTGSPVNLTTTGAPATTGVWYALEFSYGADGHCRFFVDGVLIQATSTPDLTRRDDITVAQAALSQYFSIGTAYIQDPGFAGNCMLGDICDVQLINGSGGHVAAYTLESYPLPDGPYVPYASVEVTAHKAGSADIAKLFEITTIQPAPRTVTCAFSPAALVLAGDEDGVVASITSYTATVQVLVDNALDTTGYAISALQYSAAGITATYSGQTVTMSAWPSSLASGNITATLVRAGYPTKQAVLNISRTQRPRRAQTQQLDKTVLLIAGETGGKVPSSSYTGATVAMTVALGGVDDTVNWTFTRTASAGLTTTISGNTVTLTAMADATDSGTIDITATRTGWTTTTLRCTVTKTRLLPPSGVAPPTDQVSILADSATGSASAQIQLLADGTIASVINGGSPTTIGNWFKPTTGAIGASYWAKADRIGGILLASGTVGTWQQLNTTRSWERATVSAGGNFSTQTMLRISIASDSAGATVLGSFTVLLSTYNI